MCLPSIAVSDASIRVLSDNGLLLGGLSQALGTFYIHHARGIRIMNSTRPMNHELLDEFKKLSILLWKFRGHHAIDVLRRAQLELGCQKDNDVGMRKATLLKLNGVKECIDLTQHSLSDLLNE